MNHRLDTNQSIGDAAVLHTASPPVTYEARLAADSRWALSEGSRHFEGKSAVQEALRKIAARLDEIGVPYAIAGGMALFRHGYRRFTEDVDILVTREGLKAIHEKLDGLGYVPVFTGSKNLRDAELGVRIEFLVTNQFPGDGKPKPVAFPEPSQVAFASDGVNYVDLPTLIEVKLASGMTSAERIRDLADVQGLIKTLDLPADFDESLNPFVRDKYKELFRAVTQAPRRYVRLWRTNFITVDVNTIDEMIVKLQEAVGTLKAMSTDGVTLEWRTDEDACLVTTDPDVARKYDMHDESEFWDEGMTDHGSHENRR